MKNHSQNNNSKISLGESRVKLFQSQKEASATRSPDEKLIDGLYSRRISQKEFIAIVQEESKLNSYKR